jgi:hypothetical protein
MIDEELDDAVGRVAQEEGVSQATVIRRLLREALQWLPPVTGDPCFA